jgi:nucleotide-binding universal stress UspA family protein
LIIPENSPLKIERIVAPIDFSAHSIEVVRTALALRKRLQPKPEIIALNVYEMPNLSVYRIQKTREELKRIMEEDRQAAFDAFLRQHANNERKYITTALIEQQKPGIANYLIEFAAEKSADLIIMGAKGHSKVELLLLGSITEKLLSENENIPVLVVKEL